MFYSTDSGREGVWRVGTARNVVFFHSFAALQVSFQKRELRRIGCPRFSRCRQNLHHAVAREQFGSRNRQKLAGLEHFLKSPRKASFLTRREASFWSFKEFQIHWVSKWMTCQPIEPQSKWIWNLNLKSSESHIVWISSHYILESQIHWILNPKSMVDNEIIWNSNQLTTKSLGAPTNWQPKLFESQTTWTSKQLISYQLKPKWTDNKTLEPQIDGISMQLNLKSLEFQVHWISKQMTCKTVEFEIKWFSNQLNPTPSSYRCLIFGNFRHRLVR